MYPPQSTADQLAALNVLGGQTPQMSAAAVMQGTLASQQPPLSEASLAELQTSALGAGNSMFGWNMDTAKLALGGLQTLGNLWMGSRALKLAKDQFNYQKGVTETNLVNSIQSYNTALQDRAYNRADATNSSKASADAYVEANKAIRQ